MTIDFTYDYPYCSQSSKGRFTIQWSESQERVNGNYVYPMIFNTPVPNCSHIEVDIEIENTGTGTVCGLLWDFLVYRKSYGWYTVKQFTLPRDGKYTLVADIKNYSITRFVFSPSKQQQSSYKWTSSYIVNKLTITEGIELSELNTGTFINGVYPNNYGLTKNITEMFVNVDGTLKRVTDVLVNIDDKLISVPPVYSAYLKTKSDSTYLYKFTPPITKTLEPDPSWDGGELSDGSFEDGSGWMTTRGGSTVAKLNLDDAYHGSKSFAFYYAGGTEYINNAYHAVYLTPGTYQLSYYSKGSSAGNVHIENSSGTRVLEGTAAGKTSSWAKVDCTNELTVYNATTLYVRAVSTGTDRLIDGIRLIKKGTMPLSATTKYRIKNIRLSGDHEIRLYDSDFNPMYDGYFYDKTFDLAEGKDYYISLTHYYNADESESYLQIYKED